MPFCMDEADVSQQTRGEVVAVLGERFGQQQPPPAYAPSAVSTSTSSALMSGKEMTSRIDG